VPGTAVSKSITWVAAADVALSDVNTIVTLVKATANCASSSVQTNDFATAVAGARSSISYRDTAGNRGLYLCVIARDGQGKLLPIGDLTLNVSTSVASFASGGTVTRYIAAGGFTTGNTYDNTARIYGDNLSKGAGAVTVSVTKGSTTISRSLTLTQYGKISSVTAVQSNYALADAQVGDDYYSSSTTGAVVAYLVCKDSNGTTVPGCDYDGDGTIAADSGDTDAMYLVTDSDLIAGTPAFSASSPASVSEAGTLTFSLNQQSAAVDAGATSGLLLTVNNATSTAKNQKMTVTVYLKDASETTPTAKLSVPVVLYRSGSAAKVTVTPAATTLLPGAVTTVEVSAVDDAGYPVADGTAVSVVATNGSVVSGGSSALSNGKLSTGKQFTAGDSASSSSVVATVGKIATSAKISIDGVVDSSAAADAG
jgi:hypothetical protein